MVDQNPIENFLKVYSEDLEAPVETILRLSNLFVRDMPGSDEGTEWENENVDIVLDNLAKLVEFNAALKSSGTQAYIDERGFPDIDAIERALGRIEISGEKDDRRALEDAIKTIHVSSFSSAIKHAGDIRAAVQYMRTHNAVRNANQGMSSELEEEIGLRLLRKTTGIDRTPVDPETLQMLAVVSEAIRERFGNSRTPYDAQNSILMTHPATKNVKNRSDLTRDDMSRPSTTLKDLVEAFISCLKSGSSINSPFELADRIRRVSPPGHDISGGSFGSQSPGRNPT